MRSLYNNRIGDEGARAVAEALKSNATLTNLECVCFPSSSFVLAGCAQRVLTHFFPHRERAHSLYDNDIGDEGARAFKEMFAFNGTLTYLNG